MLKAAVLTERYIKWLSKDRCNVGKYPCYIPEFYGCLLDASSRI